MTDKNYCMSSYLGLKYIEDGNINFSGKIRHCNYMPPADNERVLVKNAKELNRLLEEQITNYQDKNLGVFLSGGMDSAIVASYLKGRDAYTFRYIGINYPQDELHRAEAFAKYYNLKLHYVDITWDTMIKYLDELMQHKAAPVYYIEPQLHQAALQAKLDGVEMILVGEGSDIVFGGLDWLLAKDWTMEEFEKIYISMDPENFLRNPVSLQPIFERYRLPNNRIDYLRFLDDIFRIEAYTAYENAFSVAEMPYFDPFERLKMATPLDLNRIRGGEPKYIVRELFKMRYPNCSIPCKIRMPNPLDCYMRDWKGPSRREFILKSDVRGLKGKWKWQLYCLERFLNLYDF